jgi:hypothetical protein
MRESATREFGGTLAEQEQEYAVGQQGTSRLDSAKWADHAVTTDRGQPRFYSGSQIVARTSTASFCEHFGNLMCCHLLWFGLKEKWDIIALTNFLDAR